VIGSRVRRVDPGQPKKKKHTKKTLEAKDQHTTKPKSAALSLFLVFIFPPNIEENEPA
jgi:hypothetical protein